MSFFVIADDLTGACEIAGVAFAEGRVASVVLDPALIDRTSASGGFAEDEVVVLDTDTRLGTSEYASQALETAGRAFHRLQSHKFFKKTDSVLRGHVRAELEAMARSMYLGRIVLVPSNPGLGRAVVNGEYRIRGTPLDQTHFATDPFHPARSSDVRQLLRGPGDLTIRSARPGEALPGRTIVVGDADSYDDLKRWAEQCRDEHVFTAGSSAFFLECLRADRRPHERSKPGSGTTPVDLHTGGLLTISGTTVETQKSLLRDAPDAVPLRQTDLVSPAHWIARVEQQLDRTHRAQVFFDEAVADGLAGGIASAFARLVERIHARRTARHFVIEGGATSAAIARHMGWKRLHVVHQWIPGVVTLRPDKTPDLLVTAKPGSYPWPEELLAPFVSTRLSKPTQ